VERATFLPLALEYPFWEERFPEALARFGAPLSVPLADPDPGIALACFADHLAAAQDALAADARRRNRDAFEVLIGGAAGVGGFYDLWRRVKAFFRGERFRAEHGA
jgi:hypothetical protein